MAEDGVERKLTTILAADVVGYSYMMAADEAGTLAQLKAHRKELIEPKTAEYHGRVVKLMGDGTLMEFGSVVDAVNFAVDVQRAMALRNTDVPEDQQITYRIGINIGDIIVEDDDIYERHGKPRLISETNTGEYGAAVARDVHQELKRVGGVKLPREFVFMDRAAVGLGSVFMHLDAEMNWHQMFNELITDFDVDAMEARQAELFGRHGQPMPSELD